MVFDTLREVEINVELNVYRNELAGKPVHTVN